ncbi:hypothetical protein LRS04_04425 [Phenylobacterium sp. J367]|nr:hypothetical protein [Phenylobacterium sp. J367]MCR5877709.1 hypothetical protein [Phenylobacterium sp. J367]
MPLGGVLRQGAEVHGLERAVVALQPCDPQQGLEHALQAHSLLQRVGGPGPGLLRRVLHRRQLLEVGAQAGEGVRSSWAMLSETRLIEATSSSMRASISFRVPASWSKSSPLPRSFTRPERSPAITARAARLIDSRRWPTA